MFDKNKVKIFGHVLIRNQKSGEILLDKENAIHFENMSIALARSLANKPNGPIFSMSFGNGGSAVDSLGVITFLEPNTIGTTADLYNQTFSKVVDDTSPSVVDPVMNNMIVQHEDTKFFSDVIITATLDFGEPAGQEAFDTSTVFTEDFVFDELGLKTETDVLLLTHVIFHPIQKSLNRVIEIIYTIRIAVS